MCHDISGLNVLVSSVRSPQDHAFVCPQHRTRGRVMTAADSQYVTRRSGVRSRELGLFTYIYDSMTSRLFFVHFHLFHSYYDPLVPFFPNIFLLLLSSFRFYAPILSTQRPAAIHSYDPRTRRPLASVLSARYSPAHIPTAQTASLARWNLHWLSYAGSVPSRWRRWTIQQRAQIRLVGSSFGEAFHRHREIDRMSKGRGGKVNECDKREDPHAAGVHAGLFGQVTQAGALGPGNGREAAEGFGVSVQGVSVAVGKELS